MTKEERLKAVKEGIKELSQYNDGEVQIWINTAMKFIEKAGATKEDVESEEAIGVITLCVDHLRLREDFSQTTLMIVSQFALGGD